MALAFDTHQYVKELQEVGVPEKQAEVQVKMFSDVLERREQLYKQHLASKQDLEDTKVLLRQDIADVKLDLKQDIADVKLDLKQDITDVRQELKDVKHHLEVKMHENTISLIKWMTAILIAQAASIVALIKLL